MLFDALQIKNIVSMIIKQSIFSFIEIKQNIGNFTLLEKINTLIIFKYKLLFCTYCQSKSNKSKDKTNHAIVTKVLIESLVYSLLLGKTWNLLSLLSCYTHSLSCYICEDNTMSGSVSRIAYKD